MFHQCRPSKVWQCLGLTLICLAWLGGCDRSGTPTTNPTANIGVVATVYPLADIAREVGGSTVSVSSLIEGVNDPRDLEPDETQRTKLRDSDFTVTSGYDDHWARVTLSILQQDRRLIRPELTPSGAADAQLVSGEADLWLDLQVAKEISGVIADRLAVREPGSEAEYRQRCAGFQKNIDVLDAEYRPRLVSLRTQAFLTLRPTWSAMVHRYGLEEVAPLNTSPSRLSGVDIFAIKQAARDHHTTVLAIDANLPSAEQSLLETQTGLHLMRLDAGGSSAPDGRSTYLKLMRYNFEELIRALR